MQCKIVSLTFKYAFFLSIFKLDYRKIKSFDKVSFEFDHYLLAIYGHSYVQKRLIYTTMLIFFAHIAILNSIIGHTVVLRSSLETCENAMNLGSN